MPNSYFRFKQFLIEQGQSAMKVTTDGCLFGAWIANQLKNKNVQTVLDIGCGTGLLSLMIAQQSESSVVGIEIDPETAVQANSNVNASPWNERVKIIEGDVKKCLKEDERYEVIVSNPPFYENELQSPDIKKKLAHHDSGLLLDELFAIIQQHISLEGEFYLMIPPKRMKSVEQLANHHNFIITRMIKIKQTPHHQPFRYLIAAKHVSSITNDIEKKEILIQDSQQGYSQEFIVLLKDYYLAF